MPKFHCSYAYDISCYRDFIVEAETEEAAEKLMNEALAADKFARVTAEPNPENYAGAERCFVSTQADDDEDLSGEPTLEQVLATG